MPMPSAMPPRDCSPWRSARRFGSSSMRQKVSTRTSRMRSWRQPGSRRSSLRRSSGSSRGRSSPSSQSAPPSTSSSPSWRSSISETSPGLTGLGSLSSSRSRRSPTLAPPGPSWDQCPTDSGSHPRSTPRSLRHSSIESLRPKSVAWPPTFAICRNAASTRRWPSPAWGSATLAASSSTSPSS